MAAKAYIKIPQSAFVRYWRKIWSNIEKSKEGNPETKQNPINVLESTGNDLLLVNLKKILVYNDHM